jgi:hypothetical protein
MSVGVFFDYFVAPSDADAAQVVTEGPSGRYRSIDGEGIEPEVNLGQFQEMLTGKTFDQQLDDPESYKFVASANDGQKLVLRLEPAFVAALAAADVDALTRLALPWSRIEEFRGLVPVDVLSEFLTRLREFASEAIAASAGVYCWICV